MTDDRKAKLAVYFQLNKHRWAHYNAKYRDTIKQEMVEAYGGECVMCGEDDVIVLSLDHIYDDAYIEKEEFGENARGGHKHYSRLKAEGWPKERFQLLCHNCNARKEYNRRREEIELRWGEREIVDKSIAHSNVGPKANNQSGFKGVFWNTQKQRWVGKFSLKTGQIHVGFFTNIRDAAKAVRAKSIELWGDKAIVLTNEDIEEIAARTETQEKSEPISTILTLDELDL